MKSSAPGTGTSRVEICNIDKFGIWVLVDEAEYFLAFSEFPWFRQATLQQILNVDRPGTDHLRWPDLDVDLSLDSINHPAEYPLIYT